MIQSPRQLTAKSGQRKKRAEERGRRKRTYSHRSQVKGRKSIWWQSPTLQCRPRSGNSGVPIGPRNRALAAGSERNPPVSVLLPPRRPLRSLPPAGKRGEEGVARRRRHGRGRGTKSNRKRFDGGQVFGLVRGFIRGMTACPWSLVLYLALESSLLLR
jgi:hypothetical protein